MLFVVSFFFLVAVAMRRAVSISTAQTRNHALERQLRTGDHTPRLI
jgi:hypothetical protein